MDTTLPTAGSRGAAHLVGATLSLLLLASTAGCSAQGDGDPSGPPGPATSMEKSWGDAQTGPSGTLLPSPLEVVVTDAAGEPVPGVEVRFRSGEGRVVPSRGETDSDGRRSVRLLLPDREGTVTVTASSAGLPEVAFRAEAVEAPPNPYSFPVEVSGRRIVDAEDRPVVLNGDAAWGIAVMLDSSGVETYLDARVAQGVNAILFRGIDHLFAPAAPANAFGDRPFADTLPGGEEDFTALDPDYWSWVEWIVSEARERGVICLIAPAYVGFRLGEQGWAEAMEANGVSRLEAYGDSLGRRFRGHGNVIWVMGGDSEPVADGRNVLAEVNAVAAGIEGAMPDAVFTAHAGRGTSALEAYDEPWLDVNTTYSDTAQGPADLERDWERTDGAGEPAMPSVWIEGYYENEHSMTPVQLRSQMYWSLLGGAVGHVYGAHPVWSFDAAPGADFGDTSAPPYDTWRNALHTDVAGDLSHVRRLIDTRPVGMLEPDHEGSVVTGGREGRSGFAAAARASDGSLVLAYLPDRRELTVDMSRVTTDTVATASWVDPRSGDTIRIGDFATEGERTFSPPSDADWLLVVEDAPH